MLYSTDNPHGGDVYSSPVRIDFSANTNPFGIPEGIRNAMTEAVSAAEHYPDPYCQQAVRAISEYEAIPERSILLGNGAAELIYSFCNVLKPQTVLMPVPTFSEYGSALSANGSRIIPCFLREDEEFALTSRFMEALRDVKPEAVFLCDPNNPTGRLIPDDLLEEIIRYCAGAGIRIFIDECFIGLTESRFPINNFLKHAPDLFILKAFTKSFALAGVRIGYALSTDCELLTRMSQTVQPWNVSVIAQAAAAAVPSQKSELEHAVKYIAREREWLKTELEAGGLKVITSDANFLLFKGPEGLDCFLRGEGIAIRNCANFTGLDTGWYRTAVRLHEENKILVQLIRTFSGRGN